MQQGVKMVYNITEMMKESLIFEIILDLDCERSILSCHFPQEVKTSIFKEISCSQVIWCLPMSTASTNSTYSSLCIATEAFCLFLECPSSLFFRALLLPFPIPGWLYLCLVNPNKSLSTPPRRYLFENVFSSLPLEQDLFSIHIASSKCLFSL